jgi:hypothetical protein
MPTLEPRTNPKRGLFTIAGGRNAAFTFALVSTLFLLGQQITEASLRLIAYSDGGPMVG